MIMKATYIAMYVMIMKAIYVYSAYKDNTATMQLFIVQSLYITQPIEP